MTGRTRTTLAWDGCLNARDVGGLSARDSRSLRTGVLIRADSPTYLSADGIAALRAADPSLVIDLRFPGERLPGGIEEIEHPYGADARYRALPMFDPATEDLDPTVLDAMSMAELYCSSLDRNAPRIVAAVRSIATEAGAGPVVVHCVSGKDRTGIIIALVLAVCGVPYEDIIADYVTSYPLLAERMSTDLAALGPAPEEVTARRAGRQRTEPETMREHLDQQYGGAVDYLLTHGMTEVEIGTLRTFLLDPPRRTG